MHLVTVSDYSGSYPIGYFTIDVDDNSLRTINILMQTGHICISCYDQGEFRISGHLTKFEKIEQEIPLIHRTQMGGYPRPAGVPELHYHDEDYQVTHEICIKDGRMTMVALELN